MAIVGGPISAVLVSLALIAALAVWLRQRRPYRDPRSAVATDEIDREELAAAEREVRDLGLTQQPEDDFEGDDWGPGTGQRPRSL